MKGKIIKVSGPLVVADGLKSVRLFDVVRVSKLKLMGEVIELRGDKASIQVYEDTSLLSVGEPVETTGMPLAAKLGPGLVGGIFDGIGRPLDRLLQLQGNYIARGASIEPLDKDKKWAFKATKTKGDTVSVGDVLGTVQETEVFLHKIMVPHEVAGKIIEINSGDLTVLDTVAKIQTNSGEVVNVTMTQSTPVRKSRPYLEKMPPTEPLVTGQRVIDTLFPIAKGGVAAVPGPFGSGKTVVQHQVAKWADADIVVYVGCGERGNEITDVLNEFSHLVDPRTGKSLMQRTVLIANTSDMPVAAREASIYTGITIAEYFRDMGYSVVILADSTSRWAEALREMSGRLEEMPGDEGYPAYLASRIAEFYERAGNVKLLGTEEKMGAISVVGAVSPPGGDMSEPVSQSTLRVVKAFWGLSAALAYKRHFPAIDWLSSYSLYSDRLSEWYNKNVNLKFNSLVEQVRKLLQQEDKLNEIVRLVGMDSLSSDNRLIMEAAKAIREDFLHQNAFSDTDTYTSLPKQSLLLEIIITFYEYGMQAVKRGVDIDDILGIEARASMGRAKHIPDANIDEFNKLIVDIKAQMALLKEKDGF